MCVESLSITVKVNEKVEISMLLSNLSEEKKLVGYPSRYQYKLVNESGESLRTIFEKKAEALGNSIFDETQNDWKTEIKSGSSHRLFINPQEVQKEKVNISKIYEFSTPGKYLLSIKRMLPDKNRKDLVELVIGKIEIELKDQTN